VRAINATWTRNICAPNDNDNAVLFYELSPAAYFEDRYSQFVSFGIPKADVDTLRATIKDMWADAPGGWPFEWSSFAPKYLQAGNPLLARTDNAPMLVINGANDYFVPKADMLVFQARPKTEVYLLPDIGHCAVLGGPSKLPQVIDLITRWLPQYIGGVL
jgi:pimeloyl-ACP methyl ester carboxylesterase